MRTVKFASGKPDEMLAKIRKAVADYALAGLPIHIEVTPNHFEATVEIKEEPKQLPLFAAAKTPDNE